jgi:hypothetical protein
MAMVPTSCKSCAKIAFLKRGLCPKCAELKGPARRDGYSNVKARKRKPFKIERQRFLAMNPFCVNYLKCRNRSKVLDHVEPHRGDLTRFFDKGNWQALCVACHDEKTRRE